MSTPLRCALCERRLPVGTDGNPKGAQVTRGMEGPKVLVCEDANGCRREAIERMERMRNRIHQLEHK